MADCDGRLWQCESLFSPNVYMRNWLDLSRKEPSVWERNAPDEWKKALKTRPILADFSDSFDHRAVCQNVRGTLEGGWRHLLVDEAASIYFDRQQPRFSLLWADHRPLWVVVRGLTGFRRQVAVGHDSQVVVWVEGNPTEASEKAMRGVVFGVEPKHLLFRNTTFAVDDGFWHHNDLPIPVVFDRLQMRAEPQAGVVFWSFGQEEKK